MQAPLVRVGDRMNSDVIGASLLGEEAAVELHLIGRSEGLLGYDGDVEVVDGLRLACEDHKFLHEFVVGGRCRHDEVVVLGLLQVDGQYEIIVGRIVAVVHIINAEALIPGPCPAIAIVVDDGEVAQCPLSCQVERHGRRVEFGGHINGQL